MFGCIVREWNEELYFTVELKRSDLSEKLSKCQRTTKVYVNDHARNPTYVAYLIHVSDISDISGSELNSENFDNARKQAILSNPEIPQECYSSIRLRHISYEDLNIALSRNENSLALSYRLRKILLHGALKNLFKKQIQKKSE